jgi:hypothetical protein
VNLEKGNQVSADNRQPAETWEFENNHPNCDTGGSGKKAGDSKAIATQIAELSIRGHAVHQLKGGGYLVCKYGHTFHAVDFGELQAFALKLGVAR